MALDRVKQLEAAAGALDNRVSELYERLKVSCDLFERACLRGEIEDLEAERDVLTADAENARKEEQ